MTKCVIGPLKRALHADQVRSMLRSNEDPMKMEFNIVKSRWVKIDPLKRTLHTD